jgi:hypothetical protein
MGCQATYHGPVPIAHCVQSAGSHAATCTNTTYDQRIDTLELKACVEIGREECARITLGNHEFPFARLQPWHPALQTRLIALLEYLQQRRLAKEDTRIRHIRLRVFHSRPYERHFAFPRGIDEFCDRGRCSSRRRVRAGIQWTVFAPIRVANINKQ